MKVKTQYLKQEVEKILNEDGISPEELAEKANINRATVYSILKQRYQTTQRAVARKIAEGTGRYAVFEGDRVSFHKIPPQLLANFRRNLRHLLQERPQQLEGLKTTNPQLYGLINSIVTGTVQPTYTQMKDIAYALKLPLEYLLQDRPLLIPLPQGSNASAGDMLQQYAKSLAQPEDTLRLLLDPYEYQIIQLLRQLPKADKAKIMDVLKILFEDKTQPRTPEGKAKSRG